MDGGVSVRKALCFDDTTVLTVIVHGMPAQIYIPDAHIADAIAALQVRASELAAQASR